MSTNDPSTLYSIDCTDLHGKALPLKAFAGQPLLIVNTASLCGFTRQFAGIEAIWQKYKDQGLVVIGVPSNDFGQQEPGNSAEIASLCTTKFGVSFTFLQKTHVKGADAHPLFEWIARQAGPLAKPRWNFYKYVIGRDGRMKNWFTSFTGPKSRRLQNAIEKVVVTKSAK